MSELGNSVNVDQLLDILEQQTEDLAVVTEERDQMSKRLAQEQELTSQLSSQNSEMQKELLEKSAEIVRLQGADLVLKENKKLIAENQKCRENEKKAYKEAEAVKDEYEYKKSSLAWEEERLEQKEKDLRDKARTIETTISGEVRKQVESKTRWIESEYRDRFEDRSEEMKSNYQKREKKMRLVMLISLLYSIGNTLLTSIQTEPVWNDFIQFWGTVFKSIWTVWGGLWTFFEDVSKVAEKINNVVLSKITGFLITALPMLLITVIIVGIIVYTIYNYGLFVKEKQADMISIAAALIVLVVTVYGANLIKGIVNINLMLLQLLLYGAYSLVRGVVELKDHELRRSIYIYSCAFAVMIAFLYVFFKYIV